MPTLGYNATTLSTALSNVRGFVCASAQSYPIHPQKIKATIQSQIDGVENPINKKISSQITTPVTQTPKTLPIDKKIWGNILPNKIIKSVIATVVTYAFITDI